MGYGKTLTTIMTATRAKGMPNQGPFSCFEERDRPSVLVLTDKNMPARDLAEAKADFIIITPQYLSARYVQWQDATQQARIGLHIVGRPAAQRQTSSRFRQTNCIFDIECWKSLGLHFPFAIFDEVHGAKNPEATLNKATAVLDGKAKILVSGTPMKNRVFDAFGILKILPGCPFATETAFLRIVRPHEALNLPDLVEHIVEAELLDETLLEIAMVAHQFHRLVEPDWDPEIGDVDEEDEVIGPDDANLNDNPRRAKNRHLWLKHLDTEWEKEVDRFVNDKSPRLHAIKNIVEQIEAMESDESSDDVHPDIKIVMFSEWVHEMDLVERFLDWVFEWDFKVLRFDEGALYPSRHSMRRRPRHQLYGMPPRRPHETAYFSCARATTFPVVILYVTVVVVVLVVVVVILIVILVVVLVVLVAASIVIASIVAVIIGIIVVVFVAVVFVAVVFVAVVFVAVVFVAVVFVALASIVFAVIVVAIAIATISNIPNHISGGVRYACVYELIRAFFHQSFNRIAWADSVFGSSDLDKYHDATTIQRANFYTFVAVWAQRLSEGDYATTIKPWENYLVDMAEILATKFTAELADTRTWEEMLSEETILAVAKDVSDDVEVEIAGSSEARKRILERNAINATAAADSPSQSMTSTGPVEDEVDDQYDHETMLEVRTLDRDLELIRKELARGDDFEVEEVDEEETVVSGIEPTIEEAGEVLMEDTGLSAVAKHGRDESSDDDHPPKKQKLDR
ncbi:hypothetical protein CcaCcLH18_04939 [Colletotrichum camelliae]|nr:hypothetical protein CcaCcLH18_04939 [Colletotrichum camelliae]